MIIQALYNYLITSHARPCLSISLINEEIRVHLLVGDKKSAKKCVLIRFAARDDHLILYNLATGYYTELDLSNSPDFLDAVDKAMATITKHISNS